MSSDDDTPTDRLDELEARIARLERAVSALQSTVDNASSPASRQQSGDDAPARPETSSRPASSASSDTAPSSTERSRSWSMPHVSIRSEDWLNYVGIGLLLFGIAFLFKYSIDQGWLVPAVRVGAGALTGAVLLAGGLRIYAERRRLRQVLLGGSSAVFYGTVFAAYQLYGLLSYPTAFGSMVTVTVVSIVLALQQDEAVMAVVGTAGGLGTPFLLYADVGSVAGLAGYTCLVLGGAAAVYLSRGWRSVLYTALAGGWAVLLMPCLEAALRETPPDGRWGLQAGLVVAWGVLAGTPVLRALLRNRAPDRWPVPPVPRWIDRLLGDRPAYGVVTASPTLALLGSRLLWDVPEVFWAGVAAAGAVVYTGAFMWLRRVPLPRYAPAHGLVAALLATYGLSEVLGGATLLLAWAVEAVLLLVLARRTGDWILRATGHALFVVVGGWIAMRFEVPTPTETPLVGPSALSELCVVALIGLAAHWTASRGGRRIYQGASLVGWLGWWANELVTVPNGQAYVSAVWAGTAAVLLVYGARQSQRATQWAGLATLGLFVGKLFLVDLTTIPALLRVALFVGVGGGFLLVSYALPRIGIGTSASDE